jgi:hypothetical protein
MNCNKTQEERRASTKHPLDHTERSKYLFVRSVKKRAKTENHRNQMAKDKEERKNVVAARFRELKREPESLHHLGEQ